MELFLLANPGIPSVPSMAPIEVMKRRNPAGKVHAINTLVNHLPALLITRQLCRDNIRLL